MGCGGGRSSRMIFCVVRRYNPKIANPIQEFVSARTFSWKRVKNQSPFVDGAKRFYNNNNNNRVLQLKASWGWGWKRWMWQMWNLETSVILAFCGFDVARDIYFGSWETVPYTNRRQFLLRKKSDNELAVEQFEDTKKNLAGITLPPLHPDSVRVRRIARNLIDASRLKEEDDRIKNTWEVLVINSRLHSTIAYHCGSIVVFHGILRYSCGGDVEIAAFIAPAVAQVVANHALELHSMTVLLSHIFFFIFHVFVTSKLQHYFRLPLIRSIFYLMTLEPVMKLMQKIYNVKLDLESDYIGLMILASAGYDPQAAWQACEKTLKIIDSCRWSRIRTRLLVLDLEEALSIYREVTAGENVVD